MVTINVQPDVWMENGTENLYRLLNGLEGCSVGIENNSLNIEISDQEKFLRNFANRIKQKQYEIIFVKLLDKKTHQPIKRLKPYVLQQFYLKQEDPLFKEEKRIKTIKAILDSIKTGNKDRYCVICGNKFGKPVRKNLTQGVYPFVTKIKSLSGVRILKENYDNLCPLCYLIGTLEWLDEGIIYRCFLGSGERTYSVIFLPFEFDLKKLHESKREYIEILKPNRNSQISNLLKIKENNIGYEGEFTTILKFFEKFVDKILQEYKEEEIELDELFEEVERKFCKYWIMIKIPSGQVKNIRYQHINLNDEILHLLIVMERRSNFIYDNIINKIGIEAQGLSPQQKNKIISEKKELMARYVLKNDFRSFARVFLPKKNRTIYYGDLNTLNELIKLWRLKKMELETEIENLKTAGKCLAVVLRDHLSILYNMDKARTKEEFIRSLEQACKRLIGMKEKEREKIYPPALESITDLIVKSKGSEWQTIRDVLLIYTSISLSKFEYKEKGGEE